MYQHLILYSKIKDRPGMTNSRGLVTDISRRRGLKICPREFFMPGHGL